LELTAYARAFRRLLTNLGSPAWSEFLGQIPSKLLGHYFERFDQDPIYPSVQALEQAVDALDVFNNPSDDPEDRDFSNHVYDCVRWVRIKVLVVQGLL
jgi:hypothetical protein